MTSAELVLQQAADDGLLDSAEWPKTLQYILDRLDEIVAQFPKPPQPASAPNPDVSARSQNAATSSQDSRATDKENAPPATPPRPPVPVFSNSESQSLSTETNNFYTSIRATLSKNFATHPPHTVQRLAELVLEPKKKYRFLPPYLRALDRVVNVSSPLNLFPLPQAVLPTAGGLLNGTSSPPASQPASLGSDESLGGALLTPIPWLQQQRSSQNELISESTEMVEGPNGAGRIETVTVGPPNGVPTPGAAPPPAPTPPAPSSSSSSSSSIAQISSSHPDGETLPSTGPVTQGEILRQEQEAGVVLNNPHTLTGNPNRTTIGETEGGGAVVETVEGEEEAPHARGPEMIGMEDTGPQKQTSGGLDIEGAVGRPSMGRTSKSPQPPAASDSEGENKDEDMKDAGAKAEGVEEEKEKDDDNAKEGEGKEEKEENKEEAVEKMKTDG